MYSYPGQLFDCDYWVSVQGNSCEALEKSYHFNCSGCTFCSESANINGSYSMIGSISSIEGSFSSLKAQQNQSTTSSTKNKKKGTAVSRSSAGEKGAQSLNNSTMNGFPKYTVNVTVASPQELNITGSLGEGLH